MQRDFSLLVSGDRLFLSSNEYRLLGITYIFSDVISGRGLTADRTLHADADEVTDADLFPSP